MYVACHVWEEFLDEVPNGGRGEVDGVALRRGARDSLLGQGRRDRLWPRRKRSRPGWRNWAFPFRYHYLAPEDLHDGVSNAAAER